MDRSAPSLRSPSRPVARALRPVLLVVVGALAMTVALLSPARPANAGQRQGPVAGDRPGPETAPRLPKLPLGFSQGPSLPRTFPVRWNFATAYFPPSVQVVLFGGAPMDLSTQWHNDTWLFAPGVGWTQGPAAPPGLTNRGGG